MLWVMIVHLNALSWLSWNLLLLAWLVGDLVLFLRLLLLHHHRLFLEMWLPGQDSDKTILYKVDNL